LLITGLSLGIEGAFGDGLVTCADVGIAINAAERNRASNANVFGMFMRRLCPRQRGGVKRVWVPVISYQTETK